jgi:hypothetical protein
MNLTSKYAGEFEMQFFLKFPKRTRTKMGKNKGVNVYEMLTDFLPGHRLKRQMNFRSHHRPSSLPG